MVYPEGFVNLDLRVGGPYLAPVPVIGSMVPSHLKHLEELQNPPHRANIDKILSTWRVQDRGYCVAMRSGKNYPEDELIPTLVVDAAKRRGGESWIDAALEIRQYVKQHGFEEVNVEIANDEAFRPAHTFPVLKTDAVYSKWDDVCKTILGELDLTDWVLLECFRFGCEKDAEQNPPTVIVTVARDSSRKWRASRDQIISILTRFSLLDVAVVFQKGYMHRGVGLLGREVPRSAWDGKAKLGVSLSSVNDPDSSATFGGYVQLQNKKGNWHKFGIACYHAVLPSLKGQTPNSHLRTRMHLCNTFFLVATLANG